MIITKLSGGLGNQMFQYALGRVLAIKNHAKLVLDLSGYKNQAAIDTPRQYELGIFNIQAAKYSRNIFNFLRPRKLISENSHSFDPAILKLKGNLHLVGYWQSEKYFAEYADIIRQDFTYNTSPAGKNKKLLHDISKSNSVSIHIRRGDYIKIPSTNQFHGTCGLEYYQSAVKIIKQKVKNPIFYIFSDDINWCKNNLNIIGKTVYIDHNQGAKSWEDMRLMSYCKHNIIANSSFSWWGAWLNNNPKKIIIAPRQWFNDQSIDTKDLLPATWIKM